VIEQSILRARSLSKTYRAGLRGCTASAVALDKVSLDLTRGEVIDVVGAVGAGKTTLLMCAAGLLAPDEGSIDRDCGAAYFRDVVPAIACADGAAWELALIDNVDRVLGDVAGAFALLSAVRRARECGAALMLAARDGRCVESIVDRVFTLDRGRLYSAAAARAVMSARVAESTIR
jgi:ABC-type multidrug transport system ATPase subunit